MNNTLVLSSRTGVMTGKVAFLSFYGFFVLFGAFLMGGEVMLVPSAFSVLLQGQVDLEKKNTKKYCYINNTLYVVVV